MNEHIYEAHNKTLLLYHLVFPAKYRREVFTDEVSETLKWACIEISKRFEFDFVEIVEEENHMHFLVQSVPAFVVS